MDGGEWVGVTLTADEVGGKDLDTRSASKRLNLSDHFLSNSSIFFSEDFSTVFLDLVADGLSFLTFFSGTDSGGEDTETLSLTAPITATVDGSTKVPSLEGHESSAFLASRFSFFSLYEGVANCIFCSGVRSKQNLQSLVGESTHVSVPFFLSLYLAQKACPSKLAIAWPQLPLFCPGEDMMIYKISTLRVSI